MASVFLSSFLVIVAVLLFGLGRGSGRDYRLGSRDGSVSTSDYRATINLVVRSSLDQEDGGRPSLPRRVYANIDRRLNQAGIHDNNIKPHEFFLLQIVFACGVGIAMEFATRAGILSACLGAAAFGAPLLWLNSRRDRRMQVIEQQLMEAATAMSSLLGSGYSIMDAIQTLTTEAPPLAEEFRQLHHDVFYGVTMADALDTMSRRLGSDTFEIMALAIKLNQDAGAPLSPVMESVATFLRSNIRLRTEISAKFQQPKSSYLVVVALAAPAFVFWLWERPELVGPLIRSTYGQIFFLATLGWAVLGYRIIASRARLEAVM